ncbi:MAG: hypothetical protein IT178_14850 [Acidobacteria bacterium]|nr:hypothetical protein [Acidobacteriota bacterium]
MSESRPVDPATRQFLRHTVATLAYRAGKVMRDAPVGFGDVRASATSRSAAEILGHMVDLLAWGERLARGEYRWEAGGPTDWPTAVTRFFDGLAALDRALADTTAPFSAEVLFQGPIADALTHTGQLAMLRGLAGAAIRPESYARATIEAGRVGADQATPGREFEGDASRPAR